MSDNTDNMSPEISPGNLKPKTGVRRVNNRPMYIIFGVIAAFVLIMMLVAADRAAQQNAPLDQEKEKAGNTSMFANEIAGEQQGGFIPPLDVPVLPVEVAQKPDDSNDNETSNITVIRADNNSNNLNNPPMPPQNNGYSSAELDDDAQRIRMAKLQMLEEAVKAKTGVQGIAPRSSSQPSSVNRPAPANRQEMLAEINRVKQQINSTSTVDPTAAYQAKLAQVKAMTSSDSGGGFGGGSNQLRNSISNGGNGYNQFDNDQEGDRWQLNSKVQAPKSAFELRAGYVIPATLISGINSELPGQIVAQVSQNISDTATGNYLLIPQGSRLIGSYSSDVAFGQERVLIAWQRIIFPDGKALDIGSMPGADAAGYSGFKDQVNNHYLRIFSSAFLMSGITAGVTLSQNNDSGNNGNKQRASDALSEALGQQLGQVTVEMIRKNMNIAPTLEIRPGYRFNVIVTKDMTFTKPYQSFDY